MRILLENPDILVAEKTANLPTQPLQGKEGHSLASLLSAVYPELKKVGGSDWGAVHRLDVETSGLVIFARHQRAYQQLREDFSKNRVEKEYMALVQGTVQEKGKIHWPIGADPKSAKRVKVYKNIKEARRHEAQEAVTTYDPLTPGPSPIRWERGAEGWVRATLLRITIKAGRRHQIRAHLAAAGHPIVGDQLYGGPKSTRLHLHASRLKFKHPRTGRLIEVVSMPAFVGSTS